MPKVRVELGGVGLVVAAALAGCGVAITTTVTGSTGKGGQAGTGGATGTTSSCYMEPPCKMPVCHSADATCLGVVDNAGATRFGLRVSDLVISKPPALATGLVASVLAMGVTPSNHDCGLDGSGNFTWLLSFDKETGTLETGGAKPVADQTEGYVFADLMLSGLHVQRVAGAVTIDPATGAFSATMGAELDLPIFLDAAATSAVVLPIAGVRFGMGTLSFTQNCIGQVNLPEPTCLPDGKHPFFVTGASVDGIIPLETADGVIISATGQSLCALLAGNSDMYTTKDASGVRVCTRDAGMNIVFQGDACTTAGQVCGDAVAFAANYAASSVLILD